MKSNPLLARFENTQSLVNPAMRGIFESSLERASEFISKLNSQPSASSGDDDFWGEDGSWYRPYVVVDGILQIPVKGVLLNDFPYAFGNWATGYDYIWQAFKRGVGDFNVKGIAFIIDSPGGMVAGNFDLVDRMFALRGAKPVRAFASEHAYSAAYSIASVADSITVARTGGVGSIGVVTMHVDASKAVSEAGYKITYIYAGSHKVDGNPYEELPDDVKARIQARIDELYGVFVSTVARNRAMDEQAIRDTEALTYTASEAVSNGLADAVGSLEDALAAFAAGMSQNGDEEMSDVKDKSAAEQAAAIDTARNEALEQGRKEGATAERKRIGDILGSEEGKARPTAAHATAFDTEMSVEAAKQFLSKLAEEKTEVTDTTPAAGAAAFNAAMENSGNPEVGAASSEQKKTSRASAALNFIIGEKRA